MKKIINGSLWVQYKDEKQLIKSFSFWNSIQKRRKNSRFSFRLKLCFRGSCKVYEHPTREYDARAFAEAVEKYGTKNVKLVFDDGKVWKY